MNQYKHVFFDLDHTLWDFNLNAEEALKEIYAEFKLKEKGVEPFNTFYNHYIHHNEVLWDRYHKGFITGEELKWRRMWRTLLEYKIGDEQLAKEMSARFMEILPTKARLFPYAKEILDYLTAKKYVIHLITNGFEKTQWSKLTHSGIDGYFTQVITSEGSNSLKPKKEIFDYALSKAGASLKESIMIGDNLDADIQGAINVGMDCVFVNHIGAPVPDHPTYTIHHLKELEGIL